MFDDHVVLICASGSDVRIQRLQKKCSISFFLDTEVNRLFSLPLPSQASAQLTTLQGLIQESTCDLDSEDCWTYVWGSGNFNSKKKLIQFCKVILKHHPFSLGLVLW